MSFESNGFLRTLDRIAEYSGVPALSRRARKDTALPYRFVPVLPLALAVFGLFLQIRLGAGWLTILCSWFAIMPMLITGPLRLSGEFHDEREKALIRFGKFAGLWAVAAFAMGGCFLIGLFGALSAFHFGWIWAPRLPDDWLAVGLFMGVLYWTVTVLTVSWKIPRVPMTDDDEDD